jgi:predicted Zn-dependent protease
MNPRFLMILSIGLMVAGGAVTALGPMDRNVTWAAVGEVWSEALWDADRSLNRTVRMSAEDEMALGERLATPWTVWPAPIAETRYVSAVGERLRPHVQRKDIIYRFRVLDRPEVNAYALPGGYIYVFTGLLEQLTNESQLAAILGHEMAHVDLYHAAEGNSGRGGLLTLFYSRRQEAEADRQGQLLAIAAGYHPQGLIDAMNIFETIYGGASTPRRPNSPIGEMSDAARHGLNDFFLSHPPSAERASQLRALLREQELQLKGRRFCLGVENLEKRLTCSELAIEREQVAY